MSGYDGHHTDKGLFSHGYGSGGGYYPPQQHGSYPPQVYAYPNAGYAQAGYPLTNGGGYPPHAYPGSSGLYHSGYGGHGVGLLAGGAALGAAAFGSHHVSHGHGSHGYGSHGYGTHSYGGYGQHQGKFKHGGKYGKHKMWK